MPQLGRSRSQGSRGFTLIELLVVVAIISVLVALLLPAVQAAREAARQIACQNLLRQQAIGLQSYHGQEREFPPGGRIHKTSGRTGVSWRVLLLPFVEQQPLYEQIEVVSTGGALDWSPQSDLPDLYRCPSTESAAAGPGTLLSASYWGVAGAARAGEGLDLEDAFCGDLDQNGALFPGSQTRLAMIKDGASHTLLLGERTYSFRAWMTGATAAGTPPVRVCSEAANQIRYPINAAHERWGYFVGHNPLPPGGQPTMLLNNLPFGSDHPGGANFAFADSAVTFVSEEIEYSVLEDLATIAGGEITRQAK